MHNKEVEPPRRSTKNLVGWRGGSGELQPLHVTAGCGSTPYAPASFCRKEACTGPGRARAASRNIGIVRWKESSYGERSPGRMDLFWADSGADAWVCDRANWCDTRTAISGRRFRWEVGLLCVCSRGSSFGGVAPKPDISGRDAAPNGKRASIATAKQRRAEQSRAEWQRAVQKPSPNLSIW